MKAQGKTDWTRLYEDIDDVSWGIDCFENEGGPGLDDSRNQRRDAQEAIAVGARSGMRVRDIDNGKGFAITPDALARDDRGWWVDLDTFVVDELERASDWAAIRRPDRTSGEYEVCFDIGPGGWDRKPSELPADRSWCHVEIVATITSESEMADWRAGVLG